MILKASQRGGGMQLAVHLMKPENEHVELHELRGFVADDLAGAFKEAHAISRGTRCSQFLFSLSLNPPERESVPVGVFKAAVDRIEERMGLSGQPRALVFHEKEGRRHAHCVWSRIDAESMTAINLPHYKLKLRDISRELYLENEWDMPRGLLNAAERDPLTFSQAEWQQALRAKADPRVLKAMFRECWAASDSRTAFASALLERGLILAKGDRRGHVAVDWRGEVYAVSRWAGVKAKDVRARLGPPDDLPSVDDAKAQMKARLADRLDAFRAAEDQRQTRIRASLEKKRTALVTKHRQARARLREDQARRQVIEANTRAARLPKGLKGLWFRVTGRYRRLCRENEADLAACAARDLAERQALIERQLRERRALQHEIVQARHHDSIAMQKLQRDIGATLRMDGRMPDDSDEFDTAMRQRRRRRDRSP